MNQHHELEHPIEVEARPEIESSRQHIEDFVDNPELNNLLVTMGFEQPERFGDMSSFDYLAIIKEFTNENWDFRKGKERWEAVEADLSDTEPQILAAAESLGMASDTEPTEDVYKFATVFGGAGLTPYLRLKYLKDQMDAGTGVGTVFLLGSQRGLGPPPTPALKESGSWGPPNEKEKTAFYAPGAKTEHDLNIGAARSLFEIDEHETMQHMQSAPTVIGAGEWQVDVLETTDGMRIIGVSSPIIEGHGRANTPDTLRFIADMIGEADLDGASVLGVTNSIFTPFQEADLERVLCVANGARGETIGFQPDRYAGQLPPMEGDAEQKPQGALASKRARDYLQEMNSAVNQLSMLATEIERVDAGLH